MSERKTKSLAVPNVPKEYFSDFVRGYFDGDGNVWVGLLHKDSKRPNFGIMTMFTSCSAKFLEQLRDKLHNFGLQGGYLYQSKNNYSRLQLSTNNSLKLCDFMYNHGIGAPKGLLLERKRGVFEKYRKSKNAAVV